MPEDRRLSKGGSKGASPRGTGASKPADSAAGGKLADETPNNPSPFNVRTIKALIALMTEHDLGEIDLREGDSRIRLRRGAGEVTVHHTPIVPAPASGPAAPPAPQAAAAKEAEKPAKPENFIRSPTPGTFYSAPSPDAAAFVMVGTRVTPTTVVCLIEAMKIFNEIPADCSGVITEIMVENQQPVEFGQPLFKVDPTG
jgi:acetyl-CoA carboxylase biotin carboxyl carrier protein